MANAEAVQDLLADQKGATFISMQTNTEPKMRKRGNPYAGRVRKVTEIAGQINFWYDPAVVRQLEKEGKDESEFRRGESWHEPIVREDGTLTPFARHKKDASRKYLRFRSLNVQSVRFVLDDGTEVSREALEPWLQKSSDYANQGTDDPVRFVVYGLDKIERLTMNGVTYEL